MKSKKMLSFEEAKRVDELDVKKMFPVEYTELPSLLGLRTINPPFWFDRFNQKSFLEIINEKKWFLAKIRYGV